MCESFEINSQDKSEEKENSSSRGLSWQTFWLYRIPILFLSFGLIFLLISLFLFYQEKTRGQSVVIYQNSPNSPNPSTPSTIKVDVSGAVVNPGVYELNSWARIQDALILAGGLSAVADRDWAVKNLNLAAKLFDGVKIYIPKTGEQVVSSNLSNLSDLGNLININFASQAQLESLPGIGSVTSQKIIAGRPYESTEELLTKKIVGKSVFEKIKDKITVY